MDAEREIELLKKQIANIEKFQKEKKLKVDEKLKEFAEKLKLLKTNNFSVHHDDILNSYVLRIVDNDDPSICISKFIIKEIDEELEEDRNKAREIKLDDETKQTLEGLKDGSN